MDFASDMKARFDSNPCHCSEMLISRMQNAVKCSIDIHDVHFNSDLKFDAINTQLG